ncbi:MAG: putative addiction module antidote protein [Eggerthellaceae bacterium]|nr:putative addiction module antidote protein [Eggerthellaceae bacterium]
MRTSARRGCCWRNGRRRVAVKTSEWDASEYLGSEEEIAAYLNAVLDEGDPVLLQAALGDVAKARGMTAVAREVGVGRESLYKSLSLTGNPSFQTIAKVSNALGLRMTFQPMLK